MVEEEGGEFRILPNREPVVRMSLEILLTAKTSIDLMNETQEIVKLHELHFEAKKTALKSGVQIREIIGKSALDVDLPATLLNLAKTTSLLQVRFLDTPSTARLMIKDGKEVFFATTLKPGTLSQPFMWTDNPVIVQIVQQWYNGIWATANSFSQ